MSNEQGVLDSLFSLICAVALAGGVGMFAGGMINLIDQMSPDYYWPSVGLGLIVAIAIILRGCKSHKLQADLERLLIPVATLISGTIGTPILVQVMKGTEDISVIHTYLPSLLYWGLPISAFLMTSVSGIGFIDWDSKRAEA